MTTDPQNPHESGGVYEAGTVEAPTRNCFAVLVDNEPGVLARVIGLISGRGYNIESLTVDAVDRENNLSRITIVTDGSKMIVDQIEAQLGRLVPVRRVVNLTKQGRFIESCVAFVKVIAPTVRHGEAKLAARKFGARIVDVTDNALVFEITSDFDQIARFIEAVKPLGLAEIARTGSVAIACGEDVLGIRTETGHQKRA
ncbi:MAG TPA: acetolactate synthase small subunit [Alphaproteobacteria bacterium]|nr:acetolactate synthase small subunit [Alphaproteobacteria bacterium]